MSIVHFTVKPSETVSGVTRPSRSRRATSTSPVTCGASTTSCWTCGRRVGVASVRPFAFSFTFKELKALMQNA